MNKLWIGPLIFAVSICACEKRKGTLLPARSSESKPSHNEDVTHTPAGKEMHAKTLPEALQGSGEGHDASLVPLSDNEAHDLQQVKQEALDRIKNNPSEKLAAGTPAGGKAVAMFNRGRQLIAEGNIAEGQEYYLVACQFGHIEGCHKFGWHEEQLGNPANARQFYKIACDGGISKSCNNLGNQLEKQQHWDEALDFYARACMEKHGNGCENLKRLRNDRLKLR